MKRFWKTAATAPTAGGWEIRLDNKPMRLPGGLALLLPRAPLAAAIAAEWQAAAATLTFDDLPLTRLAGTARHRIAPDPGPTAAALARYAETDLLCYRAEHPQALVVRQHHAWQPWLDWAAATHGARLIIARGILPIRQPPEAAAALAAAVASFDAWQLAGLGILVPALGSLVLGLAVAARALPAGEAHRLALVDELFQASQWGEDEAAAARRAQIEADLEAAARFMALAAA